MSTGMDPNPPSAEGQEPSSYRGKRGDGEGGDGGGGERPCQGGEWGGAWGKGERGGGAGEGGRELTANKG